jgi:hypothetical protein
MAITKCKECGKDVSARAKSCPYCGAPRPGGSKLGPLLTILVVLLLGIVGINQYESMWKPGGPAAPIATQPDVAEGPHHVCLRALGERCPRTDGRSDDQPVLSSAADAYNGADAYLSSLAPKARARKLGRVVGGGCIGRRTFYMGAGTKGFAKDKAFWSIQCADGRMFAVQVNPDGTSGVLECSVLESLHAGKCFRKFATAD